MFAADFGDKINRLVNLVDEKKNQFEVLVDRIAGFFFSPKDGRQSVIFMD